jgi:pyruvate dehydrogenase E2 component (dihydrolipoamide acetyltransferase)
MAADIIMPKMGDAMTEGKVVRWYKKAGDAVKKGEPVLEIETDKVNLDLEAEADGTLGDVAAQEGQMVEVGGVLARILAEGESAGAPAAAKPAAAKAEEQDAKTDAPAEEQRRATDRKDSIKHTTGEYMEAVEMKGPRRDRTAAEPAAQAAAQAQPGGRAKSSPLARRVAQDLGVDLSSVRGSGPQGRIVADDVRKAQGGAKAAPAQGGAQAATPTQPQGISVTGGMRLGAAPMLETKIIPLTAMRRTIAKRLGESTGPIPHFYLTIDVDVTNLLELRKQINEIGGLKVSVNDFIVRAAALALRHHPTVNASFGDDAITQHGEVHIGIAVSTPEGLITPVVRNADGKSVEEITNEVRALAEKARNRKLLPNEYQGSTFTISNLGAWGIEEFTAIINPPNSAILAVGAAEARPVVIERQIVIRDRMKITMSCDHRVIDGAAGADYLKTLRQYLEQPLRLVVG